MEYQKGPRCPKCLIDAGFIERMLLVSPESKYEGSMNPLQAPGHHADICYCKRCKSFWSFWYSFTKIEEHTDIKTHQEFHDNHG